MPVGSAHASTGALSGLSIATYNVHNALTVSEAVADVTKLVNTGTDVIALQELGAKAKRDEIRERLVTCDGCRLGAWLPLDGIKAATPILFRNDKFELERRGTRRVTEDTYVGPRGAGPSTIKAKVVNWVELRHRESGQLVSVLNNHLVPSVQDRDGGPNDNTARLALYRKHMQGLGALMVELAGQGGPVFVTGDFNVNHRSDKKVQYDGFPFHQMRLVSARASYVSLGEPKQGTHTLKSGLSTRLIDYVFDRKHPAVTPKSQSILSGYASDHRPLVARYELTRNDAYFEPPEDPEAESPEPTPPPAPAGVSATGGNAEATVSWSPASETEGAPVSTYLVTASPGEHTVTVPSSTTSTTMTGLTNGRAYTFTVAAANEAGSSPASAPSNQVVPATVPGKMSRPGVAVKGKRAAITWTAPRTNGGSQVLEYRVLVNGTRLTAPPSSRKLVLRNVKRGKYRVRVRAYNAVGVGPMSELKRFRIRVRGGTWTPR